ncbi:hypothetical protein A9Q84_11285 [Halobacteriovorax marinus]|uniref:Uncharacterized protein n=1 Tax=Halobacteriovorax marinus TaxID=97084 RepID=A0A1Y5FBT3_9BACT|nr:hypothetical protein A9Q84_11285 [Halobacteriovorax marinus]
MINGLNHITLSVSDIEKSFVFYKDILGMKPKFKSSSTIYFEGNGLWLALSLDSDTRKESLAEYTHIAFDVTTNSFDSISTKIKSSNIELFKENSSEGNSLYFLDPDGHKLEIHVGTINDRLDYYRENRKEDYIFFDEFDLRPAKLSEAKFLSELELRSKSYWGYSKEFIEACRAYLFIDDDYISNWPVIVAEHDKNIIGFLSLKTVDSENRLDNLWIEPKFINCGYGRRLFEQGIVEAKALGWESFRLAAEPGAVAFYEKMGAVVIGKVQSRLKKDLFLPHMELTFSQV